MIQQKYFFNFLKICLNFKAAALYANNPNAEFFDFVQKPFGLGLIPDKTMLPLIAVCCIYLFNFFERGELFYIISRRML